MIAGGGRRVRHASTSCSPTPASPESVKPLAEITEAEWDRIIDVNLKGFFLCAQVGGAGDAAAGGGSMIVTASIAARRPRPGMAAYVASKSGVIGLARALAVELRRRPDPRQRHQPGAGRRRRCSRSSRSRPTRPRPCARWATRCRSGRPIQPEDIAAAAVYLASDEAANVTGLVMNVDGGPRPVTRRHARRFDAIDPSTREPFAEIPESLGGRGGRRRRAPPAPPTARRSGARPRTGRRP